MLSRWSILLLGALLLKTGTHCASSNVVPQTPKLTIVIVIDQFAAHYLPKVLPWMNHKTGIKFLLSNGVTYLNAMHPHVMPATATGHAGLSTGAWPTDHGIIGNSWYTPDGKKINSDDDTATNAAVFGPRGLYSYGKSAQYLMVDNLSDQFALASTASHERLAFGVSLKSRAAIMMAGKVGKAIWFDEQAGQFTSSKAYFDKIPAWISTFNTALEKNIAHNSWYWEPAFDIKSDAYASVAEESYPYSEDKKTWVGTIQPIKQTDGKRPPYERLMFTPQGNQIVLDFAKHLIKTQTQPNRDLLVWISLSSLDKIGHEFGPNSYENIDMIYHLDRQIGSFIEHLFDQYGKDNILLALSADHGVTPILELTKKKGYWQAHREQSDPIISELNKQLQQQVGQQDLIIGFQPPQFFMNMPHFYKQSKQIQNAVVDVVKRSLEKNPVIRQVWTFDELAHGCYEPFSIDFLYRKQLYPGRSGYFTFKTYPYTTVTHYMYGTSHRSPFWYNTHVPLVVYRAGALPHKLVTQRVYTLQLANTLADILGIPRPSMSLFDQLPDIPYSKIIPLQKWLAGPTTALPNDSPSSAPDSLEKFHEE